MNTNEPLKTFSKPDLDSLVRFSELLISASDRVSRRKVTSIPGNTIKGHGLIDKLEMFLPESWSTAVFAKKCKTLGLHPKGNYKKDRRYYLTVQINGHPVDCFLGIPGKNEFQKIIVNPSKTSCLSRLLENLTTLFGQTVLDSKLYRMDFTVDLYEDYEEIPKGLDVKFKSKNVEFINGSIRTGLMLGTGNDKVIIYNKAKKERVKKKWTRIERQLSGKSLFVKHLRDLPGSLEKITQSQPLNIVQISRLEFKGDPLLASQHERFQEFKALIKHEGYFLTRKKLNKNKNFKRDYGKFFELQLCSPQPDQILEKHITNFYEEEKNG